MASMDVTERIESAMDRIRAALATASASSANGVTGDLAQENEHLLVQLNELKVQRDNDLAELDGLVAQLKPLIGEV